MKLIKKSALVLLLCLSTLSLGAKSFFCEYFSEAIMENISEAFKMYSGRWNGEQKLFFNGQELGTGTFRQTSIARGEGSDLRMVSTGEIAYGDDAAASRSVMRIEGDRLRADIYSEAGDVETYYGTLKMNAVIWRPAVPLLKFDIQTDSFIYTTKGIRMISEGLRYIDTPRHKGMLGTITSANKVYGSYQKEYVKSFGNSRFGGGQ